MDKRIVNLSNCLLAMKEDKVAMSESLRTMATKNVVDQLTKICNERYNLWAGI